METRATHVVTNAEQSFISSHIPTWQHCSAKHTAICTWSCDTLFLCFNFHDDPIPPSVSPIHHFRGQTLLEFRRDCVTHGMRTPARCRSFISAAGCYTRKLSFCSSSPQLHLQLGLRSTIECEFCHGQRNSDQVVKQSRRWQPYTAALDM